MMKKINSLKYLILSIVIVLSMPINKANAFVPIPPMFWDLTNDFPAYPAQIGTKLQEGYAKYQMIKNYNKADLLNMASGAIKTKAIDGIIGGFGSGIISKKENKNKYKNIGPAGKLEKNRDLDLKEYDTREQNIKEAFFTKLFFVYPDPKSIKDIDFPVLKTMHKAKMEEFRQDIIVNTYLTGRMNEDFLVLVEKTLNKLELCLNNLKEDGSSFNNKTEYQRECTFFDMKMQYITEPKQDATEEEKSEGEKGLATNLYIVSTIADRLLRIVEDLTAAEGQFRVARLMTSVEPLDMSGSASEGDKKGGISSASKKSKSSIKEKLTGAKDKVGGWIHDAGEIANKAGNYSERIGGTGIIKTDGVTDVLTLGSEAGKTFGSEKKEEPKKKEEPIENENQSDASDYIEETFKFAYNEVIANSHAQMLSKEYNREDYCKSRKPGEDGCPSVNKEMSDLTTMEDASILSKLLPIDEKISEALILHNHKNNMPFYKIQYRNYLQAVENHEKALQTLKDSEKCNIAFIERHLQGDNKLASAKKKWGSAKSKVNDHDSRTDEGISKQLIRKYDEYKTEKILENTELTDEEKCNQLGFYKECPDGYTMNKSEKCKLSNEDFETSENSKAEDVENVTIEIDGFFECTVKTVTGDKENLSNEYLTEDGAVDDTKLGKKQNVKLKDEDINDYVSNSEDVDALDTKSMEQSEQTWHIGSDFMMKLAKNGELIFEPWNDQKNFQKEYMFNKYRNLLTIVKTIDKGEKAMKKIMKDIENIEEKELETPAYEGKLQQIIDAASVFSLNDAVAYLKKQDDVSDVNILSQQNGYIRIKYKDGSMKTITQKGGSSTAITNPNITLSSFKAKLGGILPTSENLVKHYFEERLGGSDFKTVNKNRGRRVAQDLLEDVMIARSNGEQEIEKTTRKYKTEIINLTNKLNSKKKTISNYNKQKEDLVVAKNTAKDDISDASNRIKTIERNINEYNSNKNYILEDDPTCKSPTCEILVRKIELLEDERKYLEGETDTFPSATLTKDEIFLVQELFEDGDITKNYKYVQTHISKAKIEKFTKEIKELDKTIDVIKIEIADLNTEIEKTKDKFAEEYISVQDDVQEEIETANTKFETFVYNKDIKMMKEKTKNSNGGTYAENNLETTITKIVENKKDIQEAVFEYIKKYLKGFGIANALKSLGVSDNITFPAEVLPNKALGGVVTIAQIEEGIITLVAKDATNKIVEKIQTEDKNAEVFVEKSETTIKTFTDKYGITPNEKGEINNENFAEAKILASENYKTKEGEEGEIVLAHKEMIKELRNLEDDFGEKVLNIPNNETISSVDEEYFVALPARKDDTRDYKLPKAPLMALPPLREVVYFGPTEYFEVPLKEDEKNDKNGYPVISSLLLPKTYGDNWELLPEIWRYMLATPNLREDRKYQQTFVERSFSLEAMSGDQDQAYRTEIARGGIYPCKIGSTVIDIKAPNNKKPKETKFVINTNITNIDELSECKEVELLGNNKITHKLADEKTDKKNINNNKETLASAKVEDPEGISELGQFIFIKNKYIKISNLFGNTLKEPILIPVNKKHYRRYHEELWKYYDPDNEEGTKNAEKNNITHRKFETAIFNRNLFGDFLNNVSAEREAKKIRDEYTNNIENMLKDLCENFCETPNGKVLDICPKSDAEEDAKKEKYTACAQKIMAEGGLASSTDDRKYGFKGQFGNDEYDGLKEGSEDWYSTFMTAFDEGKDNALSEADSEVKKLPPRGAEIIKDRVAALKNSIAALKKDKDEVVSLDPTSIEDEIDNWDDKIKGAKKGFEVEFDAAEESIMNMKNQGKTAAYCPIY